MKKTRITALILLSAILLSACGQGAGDGKDTTSSSDVNSSGGSDETTGSGLYSDLPTGDYGGAEFNIFNTTMNWANSTIDLDSMTGDVLDDAMYQRTRNVEDKLGVKINVTEMEIWTGAADNVKRVIMAGDGAYDALYMAALEAAPLISESLFVDLYNVKELNFDKPWWDSRTRKYYEIDGKLFMAHGDAQINYYEGLWSIYFNKQYIEDLNLDSPYDLVRNGTWTMDAMKTQMEAASKDLDGNGEMDENDRFGFISHDGSSLAFLHGCDERGVDIVNGRYAFNAVDDRMFNAITEIQNYIFLNKQNVLKADDKTLFVSGHSLFYGEVLGNAKVLREMDADFGIIPFPKYDEAQTNYVSYISPASVALLLPVSLSEEQLSRSATVMENFNALSYETVLPAYYDITLNGKSLRDEESSEMLNIMFENCDCELSFVYGFAGYKDTLISVMTKGSSVTSTLESRKSAVEEKINALYDAIEK